MKYWFDWLLREFVVVVFINVLVLLAALLAGRFGARPDPKSAALLAASSLAALTALNLASARRHAESGSLLYWPGFAIYELAAVAATCATWSIRVRT